MKKAFTLIELLVYMAIMSFIIVVAGRAFSDSTSMRVRTQNMTRATEEVNKAAAILKEDISQMGAKTWRDNSGNFLVAEKVYNNLTTTPNDSSSYDLTKNNNFHKFVFKKVHYKNDGTCGAVLKITWGANATDSLLYRKCEQINDDPKCPSSILADECPDSLAMTTGVEIFTLLPSKPVSPSILFPSSSSGFKLIDRAQNGTQGQFQKLSTSITYDNNVAKISGFAINNSSATQNLNQIFVAAGDQSSYTNCNKFNFKKDTVYAIRFKTPISLDANNVPDSMAFFKPGSDHIAVSLINSANWKKVSNTTDFMFWPPQTTDSDEQNNYMEFSVPASADNTCIAFEFSFYNPSIAYKGALKIKNFEVMQKNDKAFNFADANYTPAVGDKKNVKAFKLALKVKRKSEIGNIEMIIPTPNNGIAVE